MPGSWPKEQRWPHDLGESAFVLIFQGSPAVWLAVLKLALVGRDLLCGCFPWVTQGGVGVAGQMAEGALPKGLGATEADFTNLLVYEMSHHLSLLRDAPNGDCPQAGLPFGAGFL